MTDQEIRLFQEQVWEYYGTHRRKMPWREDTRPYYVMVSEIMLQQTQVDRVIPKFEAFIERFPDTIALARASLADVLALWSGLGYNRRAKFLWQAVQMIENEFAGEMPQTVENLQKLPGIGANTAGAIMAYALNQPVIFIETNVRTVLFHHFFPNGEQVSDAELREIAAAVLDTEQPREWYWALMDYGTYLKKTAGGRLDQSRHYKKQSPLKGSVREVRGKILRELILSELTEAQLQERMPQDERFPKALADLEHEGLIVRIAGKLHLHGGVSE